METRTFVLLVHQVQGNGGGGKVNLWELTPEYRKQRCDEMLQEMSELRMENGKLKANLSGKEKKIQRLEAFEKAVEKSKKESTVHKEDAG